MSNSVTSAKKYYISKNKFQKNKSMLQSNFLQANFAFAKPADLSAEVPIYRDEGGERGIRTPGTSCEVRQFSKLVVSATHPRHQNRLNNTLFCGWSGGVCQFSPAHSSGSGFSHSPTSPGVIWFFYVGVPGFEPGASCSQSRRANRAALHPV